MKPQLQIRVFGDYVQIFWKDIPINFDRQRKSRVDYPLALGLLIVEQTSQRNKEFPGITTSLAALLDRSASSVSRWQQTLVDQLNSVADTDGKNLSEILDAADVDLIRFDQAILGGSIEEIQRTLSLYDRRLFSGYIKDQPDKFGVLEPYCEKWRDYCDRRFVLGLHCLERAGSPSLNRICRRQREIIEAIPESVFPKKEYFLSCAKDPYRGEGSLRPDTTLVGREWELGEIRRRLGEANVVTLTGVGGGGKTVLMTHAAWVIAAQEGYPSATIDDGYLFVDLVPVTVCDDIQTLSAHILKVLGIEDYAEGRALEKLQDTLKKRGRMLLMLDNCEHLSDVVGDFISTVTRDCKRIRFLTTTRDAQGDVWGSKIQVEPFRTLDPDKLLDLESAQQNDAIRLFAQIRHEKYSERLSDETLHAAAHICRLTGGIPLAIQLAARKAGEINEIALHLTEYFSRIPHRRVAGNYRQDTMADCVNWSYHLLPTEDARRLFRRIAVFVGAWSLGTCRAVCAIKGMTVEQVNDALKLLCDCSLVEYGDGETPYRMLEPIRRFAEAKLKESGEREELILRLAERVMSRVDEDPKKVAEELGEEEVRQLVAIADHDNLREINWNVPWMGLRLQLMAGTVRFGQGAISAVGRILPTLAAFIDPALPNDYRMNICMICAVTRFTEGNYEKALTHARESVEAAKAAKHIVNRAFASSGLGITAAYLGLMDEAEGYIRIGFQLAQESTDPWAIALAHMCRAAFNWHSGDLSQAQRDYEVSRSLYKQLGHSMLTVLVLNSLAHIVCREGNPRQAMEFYRESLSISFRTHNARGMAGVILGVSGVAWKQGDYEQAAFFYGAGLAQYARIGAALIPPIERDYVREMAQVKQTLGVTLYEERFKAGQQVWLAKAFDQAQRYFSLVMTSSV